LATPWTYFLLFSLSSVILIDSSMGSPVHDLMTSIQAVRGLSRLRASGIVPCIICFCRQLPCFLMFTVWRDIQIICIYQVDVSATLSSIASLKSRMGYVSSADLPRLY